ncbi:MAG: SIS domain-containing protein [Desulfatiglandales bacterium]
MLRRSLKELVDILWAFLEENEGGIQEAAKRIIEAFKAGGKLLICGNGGSAADAQHMAAEFINRFLLERRPLPAIALNTDPSVLTSIGNDYSFDQVFEKQIRALGKEDDLLIVISTSGKSKNCIRAALTAKEMGIFSIGLLGRDGGDLGALVDLGLIVRNRSTPRIQEVHAFIIHMICEMVERELFGGDA